MGSVRFNELEISRFDTDDAGIMTVTAIARAPGPLVYRNMDGTVRTEVVSSDFLRRLDTNKYPLAGRLGGIPVTLEHPPKLLRQDDDEIEKYGKGRVKNKGIKVYSDGRTEVQFEVMDSDAQEAIRSGEKPGVSLGYLCNTVHRDGVFYQEEPYTPDHLAITASPRAKEAVITDFRMDSGDDLAWEVRIDGADMDTRRKIFNGEIAGGFAGPGMSYPIYSASSAVGAWMNCKYDNVSEADQMRSRILQISNANGFMDLMPEEAFVWAAKNDVRLDGCACEGKSEDASKPSKKKPKKEAPVMDSETEQLYAYDLEDGQPPIMLDSASWQALRAYADAKGAGPCGKGWEGTKPNCRRVAKGAAKKTAAEVGGLKKLGQGGLNAENADRLKLLRMKKKEPGEWKKGLVIPEASSTRDKGKGAITAANTKRAKDKSAAAKRAETRAKNQAVKSETSALGRLGEPGLKAGSAAKLAELRQKKGDLAEVSRNEVTPFRDKGKSAITAANTKRAKAKSRAAFRKGRDQGFQ